MRCVFLFIAFIFPGLVFAEGSSSSAASSLPVPASSFKEPFSGEALAQLAVGMLVVVALIFILSWAVKRFSGIAPITKNMTVVGVLPLSAREKAVLVKVGNKHLLLGVAPGRVSSLHAFSEDELEFDEIKRESFSQRLADVVKQRQAKQGGKVDT